MACNLWISASFSLSFCLSSKISGGTEEEEGSFSRNLFLSAILDFGKRLRTITVGAELIEDAEVETSRDLLSWDETIPPALVARPGVSFGLAASLISISLPSPFSFPLINV